MSCIHAVVFEKSQSKVMVYKNKERDADSNSLVVTNYYGTNAYYYCMPASLLEIFDGETSNIYSIVICPFSNSRCGKFKNIDEWADYIYVPWTNLTQIPDDYPLLYDKWINTHPKKGINIITFSGRVIWDKNAEWLQEYSREHPEYNIPMPMELKSE